MPKTKKQTQPAPAAVAERKKPRAKASPETAPFNPTISMRWEGESEPEWTGTLDALIRMNEFDPLQDAEFIEEMRSALRERGEYTGGGGAAPVYVLAVVEGEEPKPRSAKKKAARQSARERACEEIAPEVAVEPSAAQEPAAEPSAAPAPTNEPSTAQKPPPAKQKARRTKPSAVTLAQLADQFLARLEADGKSESTLGAYKADLLIAQRVLGAETAIDAITPTDVARFNASEPVVLARSGAPKALPTIERTRRVLRLALDLAEAEGWIVVSPCCEPGPQIQA